MRRLHAAGAKEPEPLVEAPLEAFSTLAASVDKLTPGLEVRDMAATVAWYQSIGFELRASHENEGKLDWALLGFGNAEVMLFPSDETARVSLWIGTNRIDDLYALLKQRQLERARAELAGEATDVPEVQFNGDLYTAFYGVREFSIRDPNGVTLFFTQAVK
jgi:catechol 2,3-dioxygenase-like lactoylglutathione lyase family enzyme